jgi:DNA (cytosine-5)-methyltransferase 1
VRVLDLFAGIGGFSLGLERAGMEIAGQVEIDPYCQKILAKHWPDVKRMNDVTEVKGNEFGSIDVLCGGFPCQPFSVAGKQRGKDDDRYLWPEMFRIIEACRPTWVIGENVAGLISMGLEQVLSDLEGEGYITQTFRIPACAVDAPHRRDRLWVVAYSDSERLQGSEQKKIQRKQALQGSKDGGIFTQFGKLPSIHTPRLCRTLHGIPNGVDRIKALGNAIVPQIPEIIGRAILQIQSK